MLSRSASIRKVSTSGSDGSPATDLPPPAKKPRLKLNVKPRKPNDSPGDTIAVSRPKRGSGARVRYSQDAVFHEEPKKPTQSPAPSSGLSSLSSAPPSQNGDREESPFKDPTPTSATKEDYGDFMSYYIAPGGDDEEQVPAPKAKAKTKSKPKADSPRQPKRPKPVKDNKEVKETKEVKQMSQPVPQPAPRPVQQTAPAPPPQVPPKPSPPQQRGPPSQPPQQVQARPQNLPPSYPNQPHRPPPAHTGPPPPIIQYMDIVADPKPSQPDTIAIMIRKLEALSTALTNFGGVPAIPATPPPPQPVSIEKPKNIVPAGDNPLDNFLSHFGAEDDDESEDRNFDYVLPNPGAADGPLTYGIQFIQNALKSWAQQRTTQQVTHQWQQQQAQMQQVRRGPGRPKRYDDSEHHVQPVIHMDLGATPEGIAIKAFQSVLDSGCLQVNGILPIELSRALRHLYMQIDHLINQGPKHDGNWHCMSYGAQIAAHNTRVAKFKEAKIKEDLLLQQQQMAQQQDVNHMGVPLAPLLHQNGRQDQQQREMEIERRRREQQFAAQQQHPSQQLHVLRPASQPSGAPSPVDPTAIANDSGVPTNAMPTGSLPASAVANGEHSLSNAPHAHTASGTLQSPSAFNNSSAAEIQLNKMKMYMPGFLPRSGQSMKFSFAPHNEAAVRVFGTEAFPTNDHGPNIPNRGPMGAPPTQPPLMENNPSRSGSAPSQIPGDAGSPIDLDPETSAEEAFNGQKSNGVPVLSASKTPAITTSGFTPVNAPASVPPEPRSSSVPVGSPINASPETIKVATRHPSGAASASLSPAIGFKAVNKVNGASSPSNFPHPGAIVVDQ